MAAKVSKAQRVLRMPPTGSPLDRTLTAADHVSDLLGIAHAGAVYARGIHNPNIKEPFYIANRRDHLVARVRTYDRKQLQAEFGRKSRRAA